MRLAPEERAQHLAHDRLVQTLVAVASTVVAIVLLALSRPDAAVQAVKNPDGHLVVELSWWAVVRANLISLLLVVVALVAVARIIWLTRSLRRTRALVGMPRATVVEH